MNLMAWTIYFFGSGFAFFCGVGCVLACLPISFGQWHGWRHVSAIAGATGVALTILSGTPLPIWFYAIAVLLTATWLIVMRFQSTGPRASRVGLPLLVAVVWLGGAVAELPYHMVPKVKVIGSPRLYLFGDSISAGVNDQTKTWPQLLARSHSVEISDYSLAGATVGQMLRRANDVSLGDGIVLLEIGGNDLLGTTATEDFAKNLETLLKQVCQPKRQVLMFELPLPPLRNEYGRIQRRLAARYHILLIPKRILIAVLTGTGATIDSIHLSPKGHQRMAEVVWRIIRPAYET
jgi:acyl-CoA thioesterase I